MKLIKPSFEILESQGYLKDIEIASRTCYKSEDKITPDSAKEFVERMIKSGHHAMLEHGTIYLKVNTEDINKEDCKLDLFTDNNPYSRLIIQSDYWYITTNLRVLLEHNLLGLLKYICESTEYHEKRTSVRFICDRGVSHEFVRHRVFSFAQESTRYCNYFKDKFDNNITFIAPNWLDSVQLGKHDSIKICNDFYEIPLEQEFSAKELQELMYLWSLATSEVAYLKLIVTGWQPQQARSVLPNSLKTELIMTGFDSDWKHFFDLRDDSHAHPQAFELAHPLHEEFIKLNKCN